MSLDTPLRPALPMVEAHDPAPRRDRHRLLAAVIGGYLLTALLTVPVADLAPLHGWIALHLLLLGAATNAIVVFSRHFAQALLHTRAGSERAAHVRLVVLNVGIVGVLLGVSLPADPLLAGGGTLVVAAVLAHVASLVRMQRAAVLKGKLGVVVGFYVAAGLALSAGGVLGALLGAGYGSPDVHTAIYLAHVHLNLLGWVGLTVVGTCFMLWPAVLRTRMADDAPLVARRVLVLMSAAVAVTALGFLLRVQVAAVVGLAAAAAAVAWSFVPAVRIARVKPPRSSSAMHLAAASGWLLAALVVDLVVTAQGLDGALRTAGTLVPVLALGFVAQVLVAALTFLVPVLLGGGPVGNRRLTALLESGWTARLLVGNTGVLLLALPLPGPATAFGWALGTVGLGAFVPLLVLALVRSRRPFEPMAALAERPALVPPLALLTVVALLGLVGTGTWPATPAAAVPGDAVVVQVALEEFAVVPAVVTVPEGARVVLEVRNTGAVRHDLRLDGGRATPLLGAGESARLDIGVLTEDTTAWCTVGGHKQAGMTLQLVVGEPAADAGDGHAHGHGPATEPSVDQPAAAPAYDPVLAPAPGGRVHDVTLRVTEASLEVAPGVQQTMWTFGGTVPGPVLRGKVGDVFNVRLVNAGSLPHSIDFHASRVSPDDVMRSIEPGEELVYSFRAENAGAWLYHCGTSPLLQHVAMGMYGAVVIDPPDLPAVDTELLLVQSDLYLGEDGGIPSMEPLEKGDYDLVGFNGRADQYATSPIRVGAGDRVRVWVVDAGPSAPSAFHVVGTQFDTVWKEGAYVLRPGGGGAAQVLDLAPAQGGFVEMVLPEPGSYPMVSHRLADAARGATGVLVAE